MADPERRPPIEDRTLVLETLEALEKLPVSPFPWSRVPQYLEAHDYGTHTTLEMIDGFETSIPLTGRNFRVVLEKAKPVKPEGTQSSSYRLRVSKRGGMPTPIPALDEARSRAASLFGQLDEDFNKIESNKAAELRADLSSALKGNQPQ